MAMLGNCLHTGVPTQQMVATCNAVLGQAKKTLRSQLVAFSSTLDPHAPSSATGTAPLGCLPRVPQNMPVHVSTAALLGSRSFSAGPFLGSSQSQGLPVFMGTRHSRGRHTLASNHLARRTLATLGQSTGPLLATTVERCAGGLLRFATPQLFLQQPHRGFLGMASRGGHNDLDRLYDDADDNPSDPAKQAALLRELAVEEPSEAVARYEGGQFATNEDCLRYYIEALVYSNRLHSANLQELLSQYSSTVAAQQSVSPGFAAGGEGSPIHVVMQEPNARSQLWKLLRFAALVLFGLAVANQLMEDKGMGTRGMGVKAEVHPEDHQQYTFEDVQGVDEAKHELQTVVEFLRNPEDFTRLGGRLPRGVLLMGPPGTGKTMLARAVAGEAEVPFFYCSGSEFDEMFVGVGARRVRDLFAAAKKRAPCIIFMDEIDAVGGKRSEKDQQFVKMTLNQLLVEMDGFDHMDGVIVIGATNFPEMLDPALTRPGRFDTHVKVPLPDLRGRHKILSAHAREMPLEDEAAALWTIARGTPGFSGADLANLLNQAALQASVAKREAIDLKTLEWAKDKILMGSERKNAVISELDRKVTAYHEGGHALCAIYADGAVPLYKATITPRGNALGMVTQLPEDDTNSMSRKEMFARLVVCMGGRVAEERVFGRDGVTSGASSDVQQATQLAKLMVTKYAMSDKVGPVMINDNEPMSGATRQLIEQEVRQLLQDAYTKAQGILSRHEREHHRLAQALLDYETLTADEIRLVTKGKPLPGLEVESA